ncbi:MAG: FecR family protein [Prevotella sp.]
MNNQNDNIDISPEEELLLREATNRALSDGQPDIDREWDIFLRSRHGSGAGDTVPSHRRRVHSRRWIFVAAACGVLLMVFVGVAAFIGGRATADGTPLLASASAADSVCITAPEGQKCQLTLPDGTRIWLSGGSTLRYPSSFTARRRSVSLTGEAFFDVTKDAAHPFVVNTPYLVTRVFGTQFNIRCYAIDDCHVTLVTGSVEVTPLGRKSDAVRLEPGHDIHVKPEGPAEVTEVAEAEHLSWQRGTFEFDDVALGDVLSELSRWYHVPVISHSEESCGQKIHFSLDRNAPLQQAVELLNSLCLAEITTDGESIIVGD